MKPLQSNRQSLLRLSDRLGISYDALVELQSRIYGDEYEVMKPIVDEIESDYGKVTLSTINEYFRGCNND